MEEFKILATMEAVTLAAYDQLKLAEAPVPEPGPGEVLCRIKSVAICGSDPKMIHGGYRSADWPPYYPFIMGHEWAGQIVKVGQDVKGFKPGDRVAGEAHVGYGKCDNCKRGHYTVCLNYGKDGKDNGLDMGYRHYGFYWQGANAEYDVYKSSAPHQIPDGVSCDVASTCDYTGVASHGVELAGVTSGGTSVVFGPGTIGLCAMMECKALGFGRVIMTSRGAKLEKARELGANICIDFEKENPVKWVLELTGGVGTGEVMKCPGASDSPLKACQMVRKTGVVAVITTYHNDIVPTPANIVNFNEVKLVGSKANPNVSDQVLHFFATGMIQDEKLITHTLPLEEYEKAVDIFEHRKEGSIKVVINP